MEIMVFYFNRAKFTLMGNIKTMEIAIKTHNGFCHRMGICNFPSWELQIPLMCFWKIFLCSAMRLVFIGALGNRGIYNLKWLKIIYLYYWLVHTQ